MEQSKTVKELREASDLLNMIDCLMTGLSSSSQGSYTVPWAGIQMTLDQVREIILRNADNLAVAGEAPIREIVTNTEAVHIRPEPSPVISESLANRVDRVKQVSSGQARARELLNNVSTSPSLSKDKAQTEH